MSVVIDPNFQYANDGCNDNSDQEPQLKLPEGLQDIESSPWEAYPTAQNIDDGMLWNLELPLPNFDFDALEPEDPRYDIQSPNSRHESLSSVEFAKVQSSPTFSHTSSTAETLQMEIFPPRSCLARSTPDTQTSVDYITQPDRARSACQASWPQDSIDAIVVRQSTPPSTSLAAPKASGSVQDQKSRKSRLVSSTNSIASNDENGSRNRVKWSHSLVERRYREGLNRKLDELEEALSHTQLAGSFDVSSRTQHATVDRSEKKKTKKSDVLSNAMRYIHTSEVEMRHLSSEIACLNERIRRLEKLVKCEECSTIAGLSLMPSTG